MFPARSDPVKLLHNTLSDQQAWLYPHLLESALVSGLEESAHSRTIILISSYSTQHGQSYDHHLNYHPTPSSSSPSEPWSSVLHPLLLQPHHSGPSHQVTPTQVLSSHRFSMDNVSYMMLE